MLPGTAIWTQFLKNVRNSDQVKKLTKNHASSIPNVPIMSVDVKIDFLGGSSPGALLRAREAAFHKASDAQMLPGTAIGSICGRT